MAKKDILDIQVLEDQTIYINMFLTPMWIRTLELSNSRTLELSNSRIIKYRITMKSRQIYSSMPGWRN